MNESFFFFLRSRKAPSAIEKKKLTLRVFRFFSFLLCFFLKKKSIKKQRLDKTMTASFEDVWRVASEKGLPLRTAAFVVALQRVTRAHLHRGFD